MMNIFYQIYNSNKTSNQLTVLLLFKKRRFFIRNELEEL